MTSEKFGNAQTLGSGDRWLTVVASLLGRGVLCVMVLAAAGVAGLPGRNRRSGALAMAGGNSLRDGIRGGIALRLGLWFDWTRDSSALRASSAPSGGGLLSLRSQPNVCGLCGGMDWPVDRVRARQPDADRSRGSPRPRGTSVCDFLRRANAAWKVQRRLRELLPERQALVAATARLGQVLRRMLG